MLAPGDPAPPFNLEDQGGRAVRLSSFKGRRVLVYFFPRAGTPGCTTQSCGLRDAKPDLGGTVVVGISPDEPPALARFGDEHDLGFLLLADTDHAVTGAYGAWGPKKMYGRSYEGVIRSAFLIDEEGTVAEAWYRVAPKDTAAKLKAALAGR